MKLHIKEINESNKLSDFKGNSREGSPTRVRVKATGETGWVYSVVNDKISKGIRVIYDNRPGMYPDFFTTDEVEIIESNNSKNYYRESLTMKSLEKLLFKFIKTNPNIEFYSSNSNESVTIYSYGKTDYIALAKEFAEYIKQNNPSEAENIKLMADAMYDDSYSVICPCGKRKSVYFNFSDNTNDNDDSDIYVEYTYVLD